MNYAYLILGGNIGDTIDNLRKTRDLISKNIGAITKLSDVFITAAWGNTDQPDFYNQALKIETNLSPVHLLEGLLKIEEQLGRIRDDKKWSARTMDIDILFYNSETVNEPHLKIPHPFIHERKFVLAPLAQIAGDYIHPVKGKSIHQLLSECKDTSEIKIAIN